MELDEEIVETGNIDEGVNSIGWCLRENPAYTLQKSWAIIEPHLFAEEFSIAVIGHAGWDKNPEHSVSYSLCVSFEAVG